MQGDCYKISCENIHCLIHQESFQNPLHNDVIKANPKTLKPNGYSLKAIIIAQLSPYLVGMAKFFNMSLNVLRSTKCLGSVNYCI